MLYLIQSNIKSDPQYSKIFDVVRALNLDHELIELQKDTSELNLNLNRNDVFIIGSVRLARLAKKYKEWTPGSFYGGNHTFEIHSKYYKDNMLNYDAEIRTFSQPINWHEDSSELFIKPYKNAKLFTGKVFNEKSWDKFVNESLNTPKTALLNEGTPIQISKPKDIINEARVWIVGQQVIGGVYYSYPGFISSNMSVSREGLDFVSEMVKIFNVADAFVMDICLTPQGWKIVEINCINSAGFYTMNVKTLMRAIDIYFSTH